MSKPLLNWIAAGLFAFAAVADYIAGPLWLAILFTVAALLSAFAALRG